jgi:hypothetical protein
VPDDRSPQIRNEINRDNPRERGRQFLAARLMPLRPKDAEAGGPAGPESARLAQEPERLPHDFRRRLVEQYRRHQRADAARRAAAGSGEAPGEDRPEARQPGPPVPPPVSGWIPIGPSVVRQGQTPALPPVSGRVQAIAVARGGNPVYAGAANGGVWRSDDSGRTWRSLMESFDVDPHPVAEKDPGADSLSCGAVAIHPAHPDKIYVGTGEPVVHGYFGVGPVVSSDGGQSWVRETVAGDNSLALKGSLFYALAVDPGDPDRVVAATTKGLYRREPDRDGGYCWVHKPSGGQGETTSVVATRTGNTTTFYASGTDGHVFTSADGESWDEIGNACPGTDGEPAFPGENVKRVGLAVQPTNGCVVYALVARKTDEKLHGLYRLDLADGTWRKVLGVPADLLGGLGRWGGGASTMAIAVDPADVNRIYLGGTGVQVPNAYTGNAEICGAVYRCAITVSGTVVRAAPAHIGATVHADIAALEFAPGDPDELWVGCDGGAFVSTNPACADTRFRACNTGLAILEMNHLAQHPSEDAVLFCGTQDNGGVRFTGEPAWLYSAGGDCGYFVVNWHDPYQVLSTFTDGGVRRSVDGGTRYGYDDVNVPLAENEGVEFYAPIAGTPRRRAATAAEAKAEAGIVAFGSVRPWISTEFGDNWQSIPNGNLDDDALTGDGRQGNICSLVFASASRLYAGTTGGGVYQFVYTGTSSTWKRKPLHNAGASLELTGPVTAIAVDPADHSGQSIYITFGRLGEGDYRHVWHFNGTRWEPRSGPEPPSIIPIAIGARPHPIAADPVNLRLMDVHTNAIAVDPANPSHLYVGADIGIWRSTDAGKTWSTFSSGLPDAAVLDLLLHPDARLLRAATFGRGVYECGLDAAPARPVELYVRGTQLDQGRRPTVDGRPDPTRQGRRVFHWAGPDIKLDTPDAAGNYRLPVSPPTLADFLEFTDTLTDDARNVATCATEVTSTRVYVQVHNRGALPADNVRVMLLVANAPVALPALPPGFAASVRNGTPINTAGWQTAGFATLNGVRPGAPQIAAFDLATDKLPAPDQPAGDNHHCLLALVHHPDDSFTATQTVSDLLSLNERKAAHKHLKAVQFVEELEHPPPAILRARLNNADASRKLVTDLVVDFLRTTTPDGAVVRYPGRVRLVLPAALQLDGTLRQLTQGLQSAQQSSDFIRWADQQRELLVKNKPGMHHYNDVFVQQQIGEIDDILAPGMQILRAPGNAKSATVRKIVIPPGASRTVFLLFDRPNRGRYPPGLAFSVDLMQLDHGSKAVLGGLSGRIELAWPSMYHPR